MKPLTDADRERIDRKLIAIMDELFDILEQFGMDRQIPKKPAAPKQAKLIVLSAKDMVEGLVLNATMMHYANVHAPMLDIADELEAFKIRMRACGYKVAKVPVKDAWAAFQTHLRNAQKWAGDKPLAKSGLLVGAHRDANLAEDQELLDQLRHMHSLVRIHEKYGKPWPLEECTRDEWERFNEWRGERTKSLAEWRATL